MLIQPTADDFSLLKNLGPSDRIVVSSVVREKTLWFSDIVGYSMHVEDSEKKAILMTFQVMDVIKYEVNRREGSVIKTMGDGIFAVFTSPVYAVIAAAAVLIKLNEYRQTIRIRIGIHYGKVQLVQDDYFGHNVNIASRLESFAPPNGIAISRKVAEHLPARIKDLFEYAGCQRFKNIKVPVDTFISSSVQSSEIDTNEAVRVRFNVFNKIKKCLKKMLLFGLTAVISVLLYMIISGFLAGYRQSAIMPINYNRRLAILGNEAVVNDPQRTEEITDMLYQHLLANRIDIFNVDVALSEEIVENSCFIDSNRIAYLLRWFISDSAEFPFIRWRLRDLTNEITIRSGRDFIRKDDDIEEIAKRVSESISRRITIDACQNRGDYMLPDNYVAEEISNIW